jgi:hypothetical protein
MAPCHAAIVDGYLIESHLPSADIPPLLKDHPDVKGATVPGMSNGAPGMEAPDPEHYQVLTAGKDGKTSVFSEH